MIRLLNLFKEKTPNIHNNMSLGRWGEGLAANFLAEKGYTILKRNWKYKNDEIDIICLENNILVFVEVKLRDSNALVNGYYSVTRRKKIALKRAMTFFLSTITEDVITHRFDIIEVTLDKISLDYQITHFENISLEELT